MQKTIFCFLRIPTIRKITVLRIVIKMRISPLLRDFEPVFSEKRHFLGGIASGGITSRTACVFRKNKLSFRLKQYKTQKNLVHRHKKHFYIKKYRKNVCLKK